MDFNTFEPEGKAGLLRKLVIFLSCAKAFWIFSFSNSLKFNSTLVLWYNKSSSFLSKDAQSFYTKQDQPTDFTFPQSLSPPLSIPI